MTFVQIIEFRTADVTAARQIDEDWGGRQKASGPSSATWIDLDVLQERVYAPSSP